ncbi:MAG: methyltransferase domain-containing protein [Ignavibacteriales bacterium]|nr:MAG: methyltransferase domain-containing protein [Ignavibacteriales bacterium]
MFDYPEGNDNRKYDYTGHEVLERREFPVIMEMVRQGSSVCDLGCGNGTLMVKLRDELGCKVNGMELAGSGVEVCRKKRLEVLQGSIDQTLPWGDKEFDYAVCNVTLQMVERPEKLLEEMERIAKYSIISFPNFGYWRNRIEMLLNGKMPRKMLFGYNWYSTGHIHQLGLADFLEYISGRPGASVEKIVPAPTESVFADSLGAVFPSLFAYIPVILIRNEEK